MKRNNLILLLTFLGVLGALAWRANLFGSTPEEGSRPTTTQDLEVIPTSAPVQTPDSSPITTPASDVGSPPDPSAQLASNNPSAMQAIRAATQGQADDGKLAVHAATNLPRIVELGSDSCASCKAMEPVLEELREEHSNELIVDFIDVWKFPEQAEPFKVRVIPTQVFFTPDGTELARHEGFFSADSIREKWEALGYALGDDRELP
jgi:thioredoxin 1